MTYPSKQFKIGHLVGVIGYASKDAEISTIASGAKVCKFSLVIGKDDTKEQGKQNTFASCECWNDLAEYAENIKKGDTVFVIGTTKTKEYNGKNYTTLTADWLNIAKMVKTKVQAMNTSLVQKPINQAQSPINMSDFEEIETSENDLPF